MAPALVGGLAGGVIVALALSPLFPLGGARRADPDPGVHADLVVLAAGLAIGALLLGGVAVVVAMRWAQVSATTRSEPTASRVATAISALSLGPVSSTGSRFVLERGRGRNRLPVVPTIVAVVVSTAVLCGALVVRWSIDALLGHGDRYGQAWDLVIGAQGTDMDALAHSLVADRPVRDVALAAAGRCAPLARG